MSKSPVITLNNGQKMPQIGLGTWRANPGEVGSAVRVALDVGYKAFDCAAVYGNEAEIGEVISEYIKNGKVKREDLFVTSKVWNTCHKKENVKLQCKQTLKDLQLDYLDLYLIHFPIAFEFTGIPMKQIIPKHADGSIKFDKVSIHETWKAMEELLAEGLVKSIGISNFGVAQIQDLLSAATVVPAVNQVEIHPYFVREALVKHCQKLGIQVTAYSQFGEGIPLKDEKIAEIAKKHNKTPAQVIVRWCIQRGIITIPKSIKAERLKENLEAVNFELSEEDIQTINSLDRQLRTLSTQKFWGWDIWA